MDLLPEHKAAKVRLLEPFLRNFQIQFHTLGNMSREEVGAFARDWQAAAEAGDVALFRGCRTRITVVCTPRRKTLVRNMWRAKAELSRLGVQAATYAERSRTLSIFSKDGHTCVGRTAAKSDDWEWIPGGLEKLGVKPEDVPTQMEA